MRACVRVCVRDVPTCPRIRFWQLRSDDSSCVLIGAAGMWRADWLYGVSTQFERTLIIPSPLRRGLPIGSEAYVIR